MIIAQKGILWDIIKSTSLSDIIVILQQQVEYVSDERGRSDNTCQQI